LKFPAFHSELLSQSHWNPGDDLGRIKVVISEGFSRDNPAFPFERIKNIVSFSFQHAPLGEFSIELKFGYLRVCSNTSTLDVLETSSIAWPNAAMWRQVSLLAPYFVQQASPARRHEEVETHSHSPRRGGHQSTTTVDPQHVLTIFDPFIEPEQPPLKFWRHPRQASTTDVSMPDYSNTGTNSSRHVTDPMIVSDTEISDRRFESLQNDGAYESVCEALMLPSAPVNTPAEPTPVADRRTSISKSPRPCTYQQPHLL
jgi:hypothetical protein